MNSKFLQNFPATNVPTCIGSNAKTLGLKHLRLPVWGLKAELPDEASVVCHRTDELLVQQNSIRNGGNTPLVQESSQYSQSLSRFLAHLIDI
jgi:hypothetical protein